MRNSQEWQGHVGEISDECGHISCYSCRLFSEHCYRTVVRWSHLQTYLWMDELLIDGLVSDDTDETLGHWKIAKYI